MWSNMENRPPLLLPLDQQILQEAEVTTPRGGGGSSRAWGPSGSPSLMYHPEGHEQCLIFLQTSDQGTSVRTDGMMTGRLPPVVETT